MALDIAVLGIKKIPPLVVISIIIAPPTQIIQNMTTIHAVGIAGQYPNMPFNTAVKVFFSCLQYITFDLLPYLIALVKACGAITNRY
jgi:hypothetical protein